MAQLSRLAQLYLKISDNLTEKDVRNLRSLLAVDEILGKAKTEEAIPLEIFNMLKDNGMIGKGNLGLLVQVLRCLGKGELAEEADHLEQEHKMKEKETSAETPASGVTTEPGDSEATVTTREITSEDTESEETEVKETISIQHTPGDTDPDHEETTGTCDDTDVRNETSELASLHIRELERLMDEPMKTLEPDEPDSSTDVQDAMVRLQILLAELDTPAVMADQEKQFVLYCQIGDLYRAKLYNLQLALQYYQSMLECSKSLTEKNKQAKAHNRLGLTYDLLGKHEEATRNHERVLEICRDVDGDDVDLCVSHKNLATSLTLSGKVSEAKTNYKTAFRFARESQNKIEEIDIHCKLGDLHRQQLNEPQVSHMYYTKMLALAKDFESKYWQMQAYNRLGLACGDMQNTELALEWHQKSLALALESADKRDQIITRINVGVLLGKVHEAKSHLETALQMAQEKGEEYGQMSIYVKMGDMQREQFKSPRTAIQYYEQALALARQLGDRRQEGWAYNRLGLAHVEMREYEAALEWYQMHLKISQEIEDKKEELTAHAAVGNAYRLLGNIEQATSHFDTALEMAKQTDNQQGQMDVYCKMGDLQREQLHSPRTAIQYYEQYLALARHLGDRRQEGVAYNRLGLAHYAMEEYDAALECNHKDLKIGQEDGHKTKQITAHKNIADSYKALGRLDQARSHYQSAMTIAMETGNKQEQVDIYLSLGDLHRKQLHEPQESHKYYTEMLALAKDLEKKDKERLAYNRLGLACEAMQDNEAALEWRQKVLAMSQEDEEKTSHIIAYSNIAGSYKALGKPELARSHFQSAMTIAMETGNKQEQIDIYLSLGDLHREQLHEPQASHKYYTEMLGLAKDLGRKDKERQAYNRLGLACWDMQDKETALEWLQKYLKMDQEGAEKTEQTASYYYIAQCYQALGKLDQARSHYQSALTIAMETGNEQHQEAITNELGKLDQSRSHSQSATGIAMETGHKQEHEDITEVLGKLDQASSSSQPATAIAMKTGNKQEQQNISKALGNLDQSRCHSQSATAIAMETENKQEQKKIAKKRAGRQSCKTS